MFYKFAIFHIHTFTLSHLQTFTLSKFHTITLVNKLGVQCTPGPIHVGPFGKCSLWDDYTSGHSAAAPLVAGGLWAYVDKVTPFTKYQKIYTPVKHKTATVNDNANNA